MKLLIALFLSIFSLPVFGERYAQNIIEELEAEYCNRAAAEVDISKDIFEAGMYSDILAQLLFGNNEGAIETLGNELAIKVIFLGKAIDEKPCNINPETLKKIYPILRVVAAVHKNTPIPALAENKEATKILQQAINDNPQHFQTTYERSKNWKNGIN
ncbi:MAG: hypothetical protein AB2747_18045 [Candidatus Thiodiazotropha taylori]